MERYFRTQEGELVNVIDHTLEQIEKWPNLKIYIGSDSQAYGGELRYVTTVVYRYGTRGAHYIFLGDHIPRIKDDFLRLYNEGARTVECYEMLVSELPITAVMEFDYAGVKKTLSSPLVSAFRGYPNSVFKGGEMIATKAADHICRNWHAIIGNKQHTHK